MHILIKCGQGLKVISNLLYSWDINDLRLSNHLTFVHIVSQLARHELRNQSVMRVRDSPPRPALLCSVLVCMGHHFLLWPKLFARQKYNTPLKRRTPHYNKNHTLKESSVVHRTFKVRPYM